MSDEPVPMRGYGTRRVDRPDGTQEWWVEIDLVDDTVERYGPFESAGDAHLRELEVAPLERWHDYRPPWWPQLPGLRTVPLGWENWELAWGAQAEAPTDYGHRCVGVGPDGRIDCYDGFARVVAGTSDRGPEIADLWCHGAVIDDVIRLLRDVRDPEVDELRPEVVANWEEYLHPDSYLDPQERRVLAAFASEPLLAPFYAYNGIEGVRLHWTSGISRGGASIVQVASPLAHEDPFMQMKNLHSTRALVHDMPEDRDDWAEHFDRIRTETDGLYLDRDPSNTFLLFDGRDPRDVPRLVTFDEVVETTIERVPAGVTGTIPAEPYDGRSQDAEGTVDG